MINQSREAWQGSSAATTLMMTKLMSVQIYGSEQSASPLLLSWGKSTCWDRESVSEDCG